MYEKNIIPEMPLHDERLLGDRGGEGQGSVLLGTFVIVAMIAIAAALVFIR
jgi:hypothetical protein